MAVFFRRSFVFIIFLIFSYSLFSQPSGYNFGKQIRINASQVSGSGSLTDFPMLVNLTDNDLRTTANGGSVENSNGYDIVFTLDDCATILDHQIEKYDATTGEYVAWVRIPSLSGTTDMDVGMFYGNSAIATDPSTTNTWDSDYISIYHLHDDFLDATATGNNGTNNGSTDGTGIIGDGQDFDGTNDYIQTTSGELQTEDDFTISAWFNADDITMRHIIWQGISTQNGWGSGGLATEQEMHLSTGGCCLPAEISDLVSAYLGVEDDEDDAEVLNAQVSFTDVTNWHYGVATYSDLSGTPGIELFIDGASVDTDGGVADASTARNNWDTNLRIGRPGASERYFDGMIDEVRVSSVVRSDDWIATEYNNQNSPGTFYNVSAQASAVATCTSLPIELLFFKGEALYDEVLLSWATINEKDFDYFTILRSSDSQEFYEIATVTGSGFSNNLINYSYNDSNPIVGKSYYWLKATDFDGSSEFFNIISVSFDNRFVKVYPNPLEYLQPMEVIVSLEPTEMAVLSLYSSLGNQVFSQKLSSGKHSLSIPLVNSGLYLLLIQYPGVTRTQKLTFE
jgi:hypothetical protein